MLFQRTVKNLFDNTFPFEKRDPEEFLSVTLFGIFNEFQRQSARESAGPRAALLLVRGIFPSEAAIDLATRRSLPGA
jgi:hypothetical protein